MDHYDFTHRKDLLIQQIENDEHPYLGIDYAEDLLINYGEPEDLKFIKDYILVEPDELAKRMITNESIGFIPPRPTVSTEEMILNLQTYVQKLFQYGWISELWAYQKFVNYVGKLVTANQNNDKDELCDNINELLEDTDTFHPIIISDEGDKYLGHHGTYIKESIELEFGECQ